MAYASQTWTKNLLGQTLKSAQEQGLIGAGGGGGLIENLYYSINDYDITERVIGRWIDGKPIYRVTITDDDGWSESQNVFTPDFATVTGNGTDTVNKPENMFNTNQGNGYNYYSGTEAIIIFNSPVLVSSITVYSTSNWGNTFTSCSAHYSANEILTIDNYNNKGTQIILGNNGTNPKYEFSNDTKIKSLIIHKNDSDAIYNIQIEGKYSTRKLDDNVDTIISLNSYSNGDVYEYTKTTDEPNSFKPSMITNNIQIQGIHYEDYSDEEICIGKWTDGRPLYQRTITGYTLPTTTDGTEASTVIPINSLDQCIEYNAFIQRNEDTQIPIFFFVRNKTDNKDYYQYMNFIKNTGITLFNTRASYNNLPVTITIKYTKTSDAENSFTPDMITGGVAEIKPKEKYSTDEQIIGEWIDGKPIYRKVFNNLSFTSASSWYSVGSHGIKNLKDVINYSCIYKNSSNQFLLSDIMYESSAKQFSLLLTSTGILLKNSGTDTAWTSGTFNLILEYTKTDD